MHDDDAIARFIDDAGWQDAEVSLLKGDLSRRRFLRLTGRGGTAVLMLLPPDDRELIERIVDIGGRLERAGLRVPRTLAVDAGAGAMLIEDLGDMHVADLVRGDPAGAHPLLDTALSALCRMRECARDHLNRPGPAEMAAAVREVAGWIPGADDAALDALLAALEGVLGDVLSGDAVFSHRDFHMENLLWLSDGAGVGRLGVIDYQDAFVCHPLYDVVSLLSDVRIDLDPALVRRLVARACADIGIAAQDGAAAFAALSLQRNLRILGVFHRAAARDGKAGHLGHRPRVLRHIREALSHPRLAAARDAARRAIPELDRERAA